MRNYCNLGLFGAAIAVLAALTALTQDPSGLIGVAVLGAVVQASYSANMREAVAGMWANMKNSQADSRTVENSNGVPFGRAVGKGTRDNGCRLGAAAAGDFLGVSLRDTTLAPQADDADYVDIYEDGDLAGIAVQGDVWVEVGAAVVDGDNVSYNALTGVLSSAATSGSQFAVTGARWMTTQATVGGLAVLRLGDSPHSS